MRTKKRRYLTNLPRYCCDRYCAFFIYIPANTLLLLLLFDDTKDDDDNDDDNDYHDHDNHNGFSPTQTASPDGAHGATKAAANDDNEDEMDVDEAPGEGMLSQMQSQTQALSQSQSQSQSQHQPSQMLQENASKTGACAAPVKSKKSSK